MIGFLKSTDLGETPKRDGSLERSPKTMVLPRKPMVLHF